MQRGKYTAATLLLIVALGLALRLPGLDRVGFNDDEIHKVNAARGYLRSDFSADVEHPMLLKALVAVSLSAADWWNAGPGRSNPVSEEVAARVPNVIFGSLTAVVLFLFAREFYGIEAGLLTAFFWSTGVMAIMGNRLAKEDTLLVFFNWLAFYFYLRARKAAPGDRRESARYYAASGASFGFMLASKYFPHYMALNFLFYRFFGDRQKLPARNTRDVVLMYSACALVFMLLDPVIFLPSTWRYVRHYAFGGLSHHGYLVMGQFYYNQMAHRDGMPVFFYALLLAVKTPLPVLLALGAGLFEIGQRRREPGPRFLIFMFLLWIIPFSLQSAKWLRWMLSMMPLVYIIAALGMVRIFSWALGLAGGRGNRLAPAAATLIFLAAPIWIAATSGPYYSLYLNPLGLGRAGYFFPHEELNDIGLRPAIQRISQEAPQGAFVGGEARAVFAYYFHRFGRDDLHFFELSDPVRRAQAPPGSYLVVQEGRKYFENRDFIHSLESRLQPVHAIDLGGSRAASIYRLPGDESRPEKNEIE